MTQKIVENRALGTGVVGEFYSNEPQRSRSKIINSATESQNIVGVALTQVAGESDQAGVAASSVFAGILGSPKSLYRDGLDAQTEIPNGTAVECILQGYLIVNLPAAANIGDLVYYSDTDGTLSTLDPATAPGAGVTRLPGGTVEIFNVDSAGIGVIYFDTAGDATFPVV